MATKYGHKVWPQSMTTIGIGTLSQKLYHRNFITETLSQKLCDVGVALRRWRVPLFEGPTKWVRNVNDYGHTINPYTVGTNCIIGINISIMFNIFVTTANERLNSLRRIAFLLRISPINST